MKILHLCLGCFYIDGYNYQENILPRLNKEAGHEVSIIASTETFIDNKTLGYVKPGRYLTEYAVQITRLPYVRVINQFISAKIRKYKGLYEEISDIKPDVIFMHGACFGSVGEVIKYKKKYPKVKLYADTHTAYYNSGTNWISMLFLHKIYYRIHERKVINYIEKYYYIGSGEKRFSLEVYGIPESIMEYLPLGGIIPTEEEYIANRNRRRSEINLAEDELLFIHTGKLDKKKKSSDLLRAFHKASGLKAKLVILGSLGEDVKSECDALIDADERIEYLGWKSSEELMEYLCAADFYCQPGAPSATLQNAICNRCIVIAYPTEGYKEMDYGNFLWVEDEGDIENVFKRITDEDIDTDKLLANTRRCAEELLDYKKISERYCN